MKTRPVERPDTTKAIDVSAIRADERNATIARLEEWLEHHDDCDLYHLQDMSPRKRAKSPGCTCGLSQALKEG